MYQPLKEYFENTTNCPRSVKIFFEDKASLFWLKFLEAQFKISNEYVLKVESKTAAAFEVASDLMDLRDIIKKRKEVNRIPYESNLCSRTCRTINKLQFWKT